MTLSRRTLARLATTLAATAALGTALPAFAADPRVKFVTSEGDFVVELYPDKAPLTVAGMVKEVENGLYIHGRGSYSIDQQRYNAQFGGQLYFEIQNGQVTRQVEDAAYQIRTPEFWNACTAICDARDFRLGGSFFDGKGQPSQVSAVSHGSATTRFNGINIINTARSLG